MYLGAVCSASNGRRCLAFPFCASITSAQAYVQPSSSHSGFRISQDFELPPMLPLGKTIQSFDGSLNIRTPVGFVGFEGHMFLHHGCGSTTARPILARSHRGEAV